MQRRTVACSKQKKAKYINDEWNFQSVGAFVSLTGKRGRANDEFPQRISTQFSTLRSHTLVERVLRHCEVFLVVVVVVVVLSSSSSSSSISPPAPSMTSLSLAVSAMAKVCVASVCVVRPECAVILLAPNTLHK